MLSSPSSRYIDFPVTMCFDSSFSNHHLDDDKEDTPMNNKKMFSTFNSNHQEQYWYMYNRHQEGTPTDNDHQEESLWLEPTPLDATNVKRVESVSLDDFSIYCKGSLASIDSFRCILSPLVHVKNNKYQYEPLSVGHSCHQQQQQQQGSFEVDRDSMTFVSSHSSSSQSSTVTITTSPARKQQQNQNQPPQRRRVYQVERWEGHFQRLMQYKAQHGHCNVPSAYQPNQVLARWVKRQRRFYHEKKATDAGNCLTDERENRLHEAGFVWDTQQAMWDEHFTELANFHASNGHCNVNRTTAPGKLSLIAWVKWQRRHYRLREANSSASSSMSANRIERLNSINFDWDPRQKTRKQVTAATPVSV